MSRSGYHECDGDTWGLIRWRGAVASAIRGKRGQAFLRELRDTLDAMPKKRLIEDKMEHNGQFCTLGAVAHARGLDTQARDPEETDYWADQLDISEAMVREIVFENDECMWIDETPYDRWRRMRKWVEENIHGD